MRQMHMRKIFCKLKYLSTRESTLDAVLQVYLYKIDRYVLNKSFR